MFYERKFSIFLAATIVALIASMTTFASKDQKDSAQRNKIKVEAPLNIAILIQDDLVAHVGNEIGLTADFIRSLPSGSRVMVGYITAGSLQVRQLFTTNLDSAAHSLRIPTASASSAPYNPYVEVIEALRCFDASWKGKNVVLLISDGLDVSRGFDAFTAGHTLDIDRTIREANARNVAIFSFYAPSVVLTSHNTLAATYGQSSLNRVSNETGGKAFFQGTTDFVTFDPYFRQLRQALNQRYARTY
jgi:hypothetical protein